ncbi:hypothetical protein [Reyranella sp. CPCC 100927]|uniref:hypothetical protein n=1 Tax=Reyranella sp. CPCC 100927 TaxID=2599616 RepID=UPI0011B783FB|nr:hypothetical protein [Reyranella sp. CPCC 100927]TWT14937.1 hypothetical protein FQU96_00790 [Reyranella sp. CPCC 100927]
MIRFQTGTMALALLLCVAACGEAPTAVSSGQDLVVTVNFQNAKFAAAATFSHRGDDRHKCVMPARVRLPSAAEPTPAAGDPPNHVVGYGVVFGPDPSTVEDGGSSVPMGTAPGYPPLNNPIVKYFSLEIDPVPDQLRTAGPVRLARSFSLGMTSKGAWKGRFDARDAKASGTVTLDRDGLGGRFRLTNVEPDLAHGRMAESEHVTVTGSWRCPRP